MQMGKERRSRIGIKLRVLARRYGIGGRGVVAAAAVVVVLVAACVGAWGALSQGGVEIDRSGETPEESKESTNVSSGDEVEPPHRLLVHVDGAVAAPGVYALTGTDSRVNDVIEEAGGLTSEADTSTLNLAAPLEDGQKVHVPVAGEATVQVGDTTSGGNPPSSTSDGLVNINTATAEELCALPGVGEATAAAIVEDREGNGTYSSPEDLMRVSGIGEKKFAKMRDLVCV